MALAAHQIKNVFLGYNDASASDERVVYVTVVGQTADAPDHDWKVERSATNASKFTITDLESNQSTEVDLSSFDYEHNSLIKMSAGGDIG